MARTKGKGWYGEPARHAAAARGLTTMAKERTYKGRMPRLWVRELNRAARLVESGKFQEAYDILGELEEADYGLEAFIDYEKALELIRSAED